jgi:hypothetical protein
MVRICSLIGKVKEYLKTSLEVMFWKVVFRKTEREMEDVIKMDFRKVGGGEIHGADLECCPTANVDISCVEFSGSVGRGLLL